MDSERHGYLAGADSISPAAMTPLGQLGAALEPDCANLPAGVTLSARSSLLRMRSLS